MAAISKIINIVFIGFTDRQKSILTDRFGLRNENDEKKTLATIGEELNITRERVRQIESSALSRAKENILKDKETVSSLKKIEDYLVKNGGVLKKDVLLKYASQIITGINENYLDFLVETSGIFNISRENDEIYAFYFLSKKESNTALTFIKNWINFLRNKKSNNISPDFYESTFKEFLKNKSSLAPFAKNYVVISKQIKNNIYGDFGLSEWPEINPLTMRDKIYLILKKKKKPLHFQEIAKLINDINFGTRRALIPTVHNELIKDDRFSLIGRGIYGLKEYGYESATAKEAISKVLNEKGPLNSKDVVSHIGENYSFKQNTILINLQNKNFFERLADGRYKIRES
jgi:hypothetical protein